jgi:hypothetical protein
MGSEIGRFEADLGIARRVRLTEAIPREAHDHGPNLINDGERAPPCGCPVIELAAVVAELSRLVLLAQHLSELVAVCHGEPAQGDCHLHDIFLIHHNAVRL